MYICTYFKFLIKNLNDIKRKSRNQFWYIKFVKFLRNWERLMYMSICNVSFWGNNLRTLQMARPVCNFNFRRRLYVLGYIYKVFIKHCYWNQTYSIYRSVVISCTQSYCYIFLRDTFYVRFAYYSFVLCIMLTTLGDLKKCRT